ncbi:DUF2970 domain-containing protein [Noviherbaspirillum aerium]|uniref:DUF2970 domain-containing protein n=1 Tax=Noviherbaspirillum aerium TaxID=2588497 RepID=UPI00124ED9EF|nr:DUF2970 domain-containing protein [Noviherbaspirillum aerium]
MSKEHSGAPAKRSFLNTMIAIAWSFIGLRRRKDFEEDAAGGLNPVYVIAAGLIGTAIFIGILLAVVSAVVP